MPGEHLALVSLLDGGCRLAPLMREHDIIGTYAAGFAESPAALLVIFLVTLSGMISEMFAILILF